MFPGYEYRLFDAFVKQQIVFLDMPGLELPKVEIKAGTEQLRERLILARRTRQWIAEYRRYANSSQSSEPPERPTRDLNAYHREGWYRGHQNELGAVTALFGAAAKGDLIVIPDRINTRRIMIGEFLDGPEMHSQTEMPRFFMDQTTPARRVRWFPAINELRVPLGISDVLRIPVPISLLAGDFYDSILELSYGTYYREQEYSARLTINGSDFDAQSALDLGSLAKLAAFVVSNMGHTDAEGILSYQDLLVSAEFQPTLSLNINSPGFGNLRASTITPIVFVALFALLSDANANEMPKPGDVTVINSATQRADKCVTDIDKSVRDAFTLMSVNQWKVLCERAQRLKQGPELEVDGKASHNP